MDYDSLIKELKSLKEDHQNTFSNKLPIQIPTTEQKLVCSDLPSLYMLYRNNY